MKQVGCLTFILFVAVSTINCASHHSRETQKPIAQSVRCKYAGNVYNADDVIPILDDPCLQCTCRPGWKKPTEQSCVRIDCPFAAYEHCAPTYSDVECCPTWTCPSHDNQTTI